jgi:hypothetical protein
VPPTFHLGSASGSRVIENSWSCSGSEFDGAPGCAVLVNAQTDTGAAALNLPGGTITSYEQLHGNWIKSADCETAGLEDDQDEVNCICQKIM